MIVHNWNCIGFRVLTHSTNHCTWYLYCSLLLNFIVTQRQFQDFFFILTCILYIFPFFDIKMTIKMELILDSFFFLPQCINTAKNAVFLSNETKQTARKIVFSILFAMESNPITFVAWSLTKILSDRIFHVMWRLAFWYFILRCWYTLANTHSYKIEANRRNDMRLVIIGRCFLISYLLLTVYMYYCQSMHCWHF